ncbi:hypothetical protein ACOSQ3_028973 [Xanthoceras sorbifolium]
MNRLLNAKFTAEDVQVALKSLAPLKAPGPDGLPAIFYQRFWDIVGKKVTDYVLAVLNERASMEGIGEGLVVLIPKVKMPVRVKEFRPISLCNVTYKLINKMLAIRLRGILDRIISPSQSAFVPGRLITDNVIVGFECLNSLKNRRLGKVGQIALKFDMNKVYDRVEWGFIRGVMSKIGFDCGWIGKIMKYVQSASYSFLINGEVKEKVIPKRGLRQGCPFSPFLFLFWAEGLTALLSRVEREGHVHGIKVVRAAPSISHLLFADDSLIFAKASSDECKCIKQLLEVYKEDSGQSINFEKSALTFSPNTPAGIRAEIRDLLMLMLFHVMIGILGFLRLLAGTRGSFSDPSRTRFGRSYTGGNISCFLLKGEKFRLRLWLKRCLLMP